MIFHLCCIRPHTTLEAWSLTITLPWYHESLVVPSNLKSGLHVEQVEQQFSAPEDSHITHPVHMRRWSLVNPEYGSRDYMSTEHCTLQANGASVAPWQAPPWTLQKTLQRFPYRGFHRLVHQRGPLLGQNLEIAYWSAVNSRLSIKVLFDIWSPAVFGLLYWSFN